MKLWGGRFQKDTDLLVNELNASISVDQRLYREDITGSMAHAAMLADCGIISKEDAAAITSGLEDILADIEAGKAAFTADNEDIHMNVEALLTARIGDAGKRLHTARSRNDQVALDFRMYVREQIPVIVGQLLELETVLCRQAKKHQTAVMPGYTHLQRAQPISFAQHLMAYAAQLSRDVTRREDCAKRLNYCPLGSGGTAGLYLGGKGLSVNDLCTHLCIPSCGFQVQDTPKRYSPASSSGAGASGASAGCGGSATTFPSSIASPLSLLSSTFSASSRSNSSRRRFMAAVA